MSVRTTRKFYRSWLKRGCNKWNTSQNRLGRRGQSSETDWLATIASTMGKQLSRIFVQSQASLLLDKLEGLGGGAGLAARRKAQAF